MKRLFPASDVRARSNCLKQGCARATQTSCLLTALLPSAANIITKPGIAQIFSGQGTASNMPMSVGKMEGLHQAATGPT